jgi:general secretion pathway protein F
MKQTTLPSLSLDQLIALNDEIAALAKAGVPLDFGFKQLSREMPGQLGVYAQLLSERIAQGEPLDKLLGDPRVKLPRVYQAVVVAGLSTGRLPAVLESLSGTMRRLAELRRTTVVSLVYPLTLLSIAWVLIAFTTSTVMPVFYKMAVENHMPGANGFLPLLVIGRYAPYWRWGGPAVFMIWAAIVWYDTSRAAVIGTGRSSFWLGWLPWTRATLKVSRAAAVIDMVGLAMEHGLPLDRALNLAAEATGDARYIRDAQHLAETIRRGGGNSRELHRRSGLPALLTWMLAGSVSPEVMIAALKGGASEYHRLALHKAEVARVMIPIAVTCFVSGVIVTAYAVGIFLPYTSLLYTMAKPTLN